MYLRAPDPVDRLAFGLPAVLRIPRYAVACRSPTRYRFRHPTVSGGWEIIINTLRSGGSFNALPAELLLFDQGLLAAMARNPSSAGPIVDSSASPE